MGILWSGFGMVRFIVQRVGGGGRGEGEWRDQGSSQCFGEG